MPSKWKTDMTGFLERHKRFKRRRNDPNRGRRMPQERFHACRTCRHLVGRDCQIHPTYKNLANFPFGQTVCEDHTP